MLPHPARYSAIGNIPFSDAPSGLPKEARMTTRTHALFDSPPDRLGSDSLKWSKYAGRKTGDGSDILPMWVADMDFAAPPEVIASLQERVNHGVFGYGHTTTAFTHALVGALWRDYAWAIEPEWIVPLPGLVSGLNVAARSIGERGDAILTSTPVYPALFTAPGHMERDCIRVPLTPEWRWDMEAVKQALTPRTHGLMLCHPHNPVGRVWNDAELAAIADFADAHDLIVVSDEIHCDLILDTALRHRPFASMSPTMAQRTITLMAPSKTYNIPGLGVAFAIIPNATLRRRFQSAMAGITPHPNILGMAATATAYEKCAPWRTALLDYLRINRESVMAIDGLAGLRVIRPQATYLAWLDCRNLATSDPLGLFEEAGVGLSDGRDFGAEGFLRLNFGCSQATLGDALVRMDRCLKTLRAQD
jgi:cystathionine beta-lyase